jgi:hypothetical protein
MEDYETGAGWTSNDVDQALINHGGVLYAHMASNQVDTKNNDIPNVAAKRAETIKGGVYDAGIHYRKTYKGHNMDPFRIASIYNLDGPQLTILKKTLATGKRGNKDTIQDYKDIINAASRAIEMIREDMTDEPN